jgi:hypothetical protein
MGYVKVCKRKKYLDTWRSKKKKKKIGTHEGPKVLKKDEHMKAHEIYIYIYIAMSQNKKLKRDHIYKRSRVLVYHFPHTCTSWSKSMALLSLDPRFDFTTHAMQVCYFIHPYLKLHIGLLEVGENKRRQNFAMPWWGNIHHWVIWECHLRSIKWTMLLFEKNFQKTPSC